jgi:hypothetical protein
VTQVPQLGLSIALSYYRSRPAGRSGLQMQSRDRASKTLGRRRLIADNFYAPIVALAVSLQGPFSPPVLTQRSM